MKTNKKILCLVMAMLMLVTVLIAGCSSKDQEPSGAPAKTGDEKTGDEQTTDGEEEPMELTILYNYKMTDDAPIKRKIEERFNVKFNALSNQAADRTEQVQILNLLITSGDYPDAFIAYDHKMLRDFATQDVIAEVPLEMIQEYAPRMWDYVQKVEPDAVMFTEVDGKNYGFPTVWPLGDASRTMAVRKDWLDNVGMDMPETLEDLEKVLYAFRNDDPNKSGSKDTYGMSFYTTPGNIQMFAPIYGAFGAHPQLFQVKDGELVYGSIIPEAKQSLEVLNEWYNEQLIDPSFFVNTYDVFREKWVSGQFGIIPDTWWWTAGPSAKYFSGLLYDPVIDANPEAEILRMAPPKGPGGEQGMRQRNVTEVIPLIVFGKQTEKQPEKIQKWLEIWDELQSTEEWSVLIYHGDEGVTFEWDEDGMPQWIPPYDKNEKREEYGMNYFSWFPNYDVYDAATKDMDYVNAQRALAIGPTDAIKGYPLESWIEHKVNLNSIEEEAYIAFITGQRPLSEFDDFVQEFLDKGGQEVLDEARAIYAEKFAK
jgi:putative aldouronate transport system substrate-binding protein